MVPRVAEAVQPEAPGRRARDDHGDVLLAGAAHGPERALRLLHRLPEDLGRLRRRRARVERRRAGLPVRVPRRHRRVAEVGLGVHELVPLLRVVAPLQTVHGVDDVQAQRRRGVREVPEQSARDPQEVAAQREATGGERPQEHAPGGGARWPASPHTCSGHRTPSRGGGTTSRSRGARPRRTRGPPPRTGRTTRVPIDRWERGEPRSERARVRARRTARVASRDTRRADADADAHRSRVRGHHRDSRKTSGAPVLVPGGRRELGTCASDTR